MNFSLTTSLNSSWRFPGDVSRQDGILYAFPPVCLGSAPGLPPLLRRAGKIPRVLINTYNPFHTQVVMQSIQYKNIDYSHPDI